MRDYDSVQDLHLSGRWKRDRIVSLSGLSKVSIQCLLVYEDEDSRVLSTSSKLVSFSFSQLSIFVGHEKSKEKGEIASSKDAPSD